MEEKEILEKLNRIEIREGNERTIKSYALRNNILDEKEKESVLTYADKTMVFFDENRKLDSAEIYGNDNPFVIEIGFGNGDSTAKIAMLREDVNYLGLEVYLKGCVQLVKKAGEYGISNLRVMRFNAVDVLERVVEDGSVDGFHIFFPDPWPKKRHHKRRIMKPEFLHLLASKLKKGGYIYFVTDWEEYAEEVLPMVELEPLLKNPYGTYAPQRPWRPRTKFEEKGLGKNYKIHEIWFERI